jgi:4-hydroxy-tetrahydrodipicolinate synthase
MESVCHRTQHKLVPGLIPATVVPMTAAGDVDWPALRDYLRWIAAQGPVALAVTADTGEVAQLTEAEQLQVVDAARTETDLPVIAGLTAAAPKTAITHAIALRRAGADALLVFPTPDGDAVAYHRAIADAGLPLIAFQLQPSLGGTIYRPGELRGLLALEAVVAVKEASFDRAQLRAMAAAVAEVDGVLLLTGNDNFILESFELGADGALLGFGAVVTAAQVALIEAWRGGLVGEARLLAAPLQRLADAVFAPPVGDYRARIKECLVASGAIPAGHVRPPLRPIDDEERARLRRVLRETVMAVAA